MMPHSFPSVPEALPPSTTHRLAFFKGAPNDGFVTVPHYVADEVEDLRGSLDFLFPAKGQDRFALLRPDMLELRWVVFDRTAHLSYAGGSTAREALHNARLRFQDETNRKNDPDFKLSSDAR